MQEAHRPPGADPGLLHGQAELLHGHAWYSYDEKKEEKIREEKRGEEKSRGEERREEQRKRVNLRDRWHGRAPRTFVFLLILVILQSYELILFIRHAQIVGFWICSINLLF